MLFVRKRGHAGKLFAFEQFERRAAAGGNKRHFRGEAGLFDRCHRVAAADNGRRTQLRHCFCDCDCAFAEFRNFKNAHRSVPQNRFSCGNFFLIKRDRCRANIHCLPSVRDSVLGREAAGISHVRARKNFICLDHIDGNEKLHAALLREVQKLSRETDLVRFNAARADWNSLRFQKRVRHGAADENRVRLFHQRFQNTDFVRHLGAT